jgi:putative addiction module CopG family antidote
MAVTLAPQIEDLIQRKVEAGPYSSPDEVVMEALQALEERERLQYLCAKLHIGLDQVERGEVVAFTPEWRAERLRLAVERAAAGEKPHSDVCP